MTDITTIIDEMKTFAFQVFYNQTSVAIIVQIVITILVTRGVISFMLYWHNLHELNKQLSQDFRLSFK